MERHWKFLGGRGGGVLKAKFLEEMYENKPEFPRGRGVPNKKPSVGGVWIFLELHNVNKTQIGRVGEETSN